MIHALLFLFCICRISSNKRQDAYLIFQQRRGNPYWKGALSIYLAADSTSLKINKYSGNRKRFSLYPHCLREWGGGARLFGGERLLERGR